MTIRLAPMAPDRFPAWMARSREGYASDLVAAGEPSAAAHRKARESLARAFPGNAPTADNVVFDVVDESGAPVGHLWIGPDDSGDDASWWIWDVFVSAGQRGRGIGRATMRLAEEYARSQGARTLGLSVFGFNTVARGLYDSLGYETTRLQMRKPL